MIKINIISYHLGVQGSNLNLLDFNNYIRDIEECETLYYTHNIADLYNVIYQSKREYKFDDIALIQDYYPDPKAIVFTDFKTLIKLWKEGIDIVCDKLYIFDNNELSYHLNDSTSAKFYHENININRLIKPLKYNEILFLMPPSNIEMFSKKYPNIPKEVFFKKINPDLLLKIPYEENNFLWYRFDDIDIKNEMISKYGELVETKAEYDELNLWDYKGMIYYRRKHLDYYEQLGRLVFEFIILGKEVHFLKDPFEINDGLSDYLRHYEIMFDKNYKVITLPEDLIAKMKTGYNFNFLKGN